MLELDGDFFGRKKKCVGAGISGGAPPWAHEAGGAPQFQIFSNIPEKIILNWQGIWRTFIFGVFLYCTDNSENRQKKYYFYFISTK